MVTEYHYHDRDNFLIDVELFGIDELMEQATDLLQSYRRFHLNAERMADEDGRNHFEDRAKVAEDTFKAMFRGRLDDEEFLQTEPEDAVLATLRSWIQVLRPSQINGRLPAASLADCSSRLIQLTSEVAGAQEAAVWPYIKGIK